MKTKFAVFLLCSVLASTASALSFTWSVAGVTFDGTRLASSSDVTGYLIYLGSGGEYSSSYSLTEDSSAASIGASVGSVVYTSSAATTKVGKLSGEFSFDYGSYDNDDTFGLLLAYTGASDGKTYYNLSSSTYTLSGIADEKSTITGATFTHSWDGPAEASSISSGGGWTAAVPEPSTAALALAGLALLLKRRKA